MVFIDNQHQLSKSDEYIYHETFVHSLLSGIQSPKKVLILGGGDGCAAREVLKWPTVESVTQVDWDKSIVDYFTEHGTEWNSNIYKDTRMHVVIQDAFEYVEQCKTQFDAIFIDLLDPSTQLGITFVQDLLQGCKPLISSKGGLSINAGILSTTERTPVCTIAPYMKCLFKNNTRVATKVHIPSFLGTWCFLQIVPFQWSRYVLDSVLPAELQYCTKDRLLEGVHISEEYPEELQTYWLDTVKLCKKLTPHFKWV
jgi:spermidine synthase